MQNYSRLITAKSICKFGFWNVRTLHAPGRAELLVDELLNYDINIAAISECRWTQSGEACILSSDKRHSYKLFYSGGNTHEYGVAFAVKNCLASCVLSFTPVSERIAVIDVRSIKTISILSVYAPTNEADSESKDKFYQELQDTINLIPSSNVIIIAGDMNAQTGGDANISNGTLGNYGAGVINDNGLRMLSFSNCNNLEIK